MIVAEGSDGSGKTGLVERLSADLKLPIHRRAARSVEGPTEDLWNWMRYDVNSLPHQPLSIYDRHPLISAYIYGPILHNPANLDPRFYSPETKRLTELFAQQTMIIFCDPGEKEVCANLHASDNQMAGVIRYWKTIYHAYRALIHHWPGHVTVWDYRYPENYPEIVSECVNFLSTKRNVDV